MMAVVTHKLKAQLGISLSNIEKPKVVNFNLENCQVQYATLGSLLESFYAFFFCLEFIRSAQTGQLLHFIICPSCPLHQQKKKTASVVWNTIILDKIQIDTEQHINGQIRVLFCFLIIPTIKGNSERSIVGVDLN